MEIIPKSGYLRQRTPDSEDDAYTYEKLVKSYKGGNPDERSDIGKWLPTIKNDGCVYNYGELAEWPPSRSTGKAPHYY